MPLQVPCSLRLVLDAPPPDQGASSIPAAVQARLGRWLGRGDALAVPAAAARDQVAWLAGWPAPVGWAQLCARRHVPEDAMAGGRHWLCLDPVRMEAGMNSVRMAALPDPGRQQLQHLADLLRPLLEEAGARLEVGAGRLLAGFERPLQVACPPPEVAMHGSLRDQLPTGADAGRLRRWLTECQMVMHQAAESGAWSGDANALWSWGNAPFTPPAPAGGQARVFSDDPLVALLDQLDGAPAPAWTGSPAATRVAPDSSASQRLAAALQGHDHPPPLGRSAVLHADAGSPGLAELLAVADSALARGRLAELLVLCRATSHPLDAARASRFHRAARWRFWRAPALPWSLTDA